MTVNTLLDNIHRLHTTPMGADRIRRNLGWDTVDVVARCQAVILDKSCRIDRAGKNWYCEMDHVRITVNASSYTIITAHMIT